MRPNRPCRAGPILLPPPDSTVWHCAQRVLKREAPFLVSPGGVVRQHTLLKVSFCRCPFPERRELSAARAASANAATMNRCPFTATDASRAVAGGGRVAWELTAVFENDAAQSSPTSDHCAAPAMTTRMSAGQERREHRPPAPKRLHRRRWPWRRASSMAGAATPTAVRPRLFRRKGFSRPHMGGRCTNDNLPPAIVIRCGLEKRKRGYQKGRKGRSEKCQRARR